MPRGAWNVNGAAINGCSIPTLLLALGYIEQGIDRHN